MAGGGAGNCRSTVVATAADKKESTMTDQDGAAQDETTAEPDEEPVTSPALEHLEETMKKAGQAADEALAPQREPLD